MTHLLPAQLLGGAGRGAGHPVAARGGQRRAAAGRFGTGSGILNMARQIGHGARGGRAGGDPGHGCRRRIRSPAFRHGLMLIIAFFGAAGVVAAALLTRPVSVGIYRGGSSGRGLGGSAVGEELA